MPSGADDHKQLDAELRTIVEDLCLAINESLNDSERIAASIHKLHDRGYELTLLLEATEVWSCRSLPFRRQ